MPEALTIGGFRGSAGDNRVRWDIPGLKITAMSAAILRKQVAARVFELLRVRLRSSPARAAGLARWLERELRVDERGITYPMSQAIERLGLLDIPQSVFDQAIAEAMKGAVTTA